MKRREIESVLNDDVRFPMNLQFFAEGDKGADEEDDEDEDDDAGEDESKSKKDDDKSGKKPEDKSKSGKTFTQEQLTKIAAAEKKQGRLAAFKELGLDPKDPKAIAMVKSLIESQKTPEQKELEKKNQENSELEEANRKVLIAESKAEALQLGIKPQYVEDAVTLALAKHTEGADVKTLIGEFKTKYPIWFNESEDDEDKKGKAGQKGTGSSLSNQQKGKGKETSLGERLAAQRKSNNVKSSYWGVK